MNKALILKSSAYLLAISAFFSLNTNIIQASGHHEPKNNFTSQPIAPQFTNPGQIYYNPSLFPVPLVNSQVALPGAAPVTSNNFNTFQPQASVPFDPFALAQSQFPVPLIDTQNAAQGFFSNTINTPQFNGSVNSSPQPIKPYDPFAVAQSLFPVPLIDTQNAAQGFFPTVNSAQGLFPAPVINSQFLQSGFAPTPFYNSGVYYNPSLFPVPLFDTRLFSFKGASLASTKKLAFSPSGLGAMLGQSNQSPSKNSYSSLAQLFGGQGLPQQGAGSLGMSGSSNMFQQMFMQKMMGNGGSAGLGALGAGSGGLGGLGALGALRGGGGMGGLGMLGALGGGSAGAAGFGDMSSLLQNSPMLQSLCSNATQQRLNVQSQPQPNSTNVP